MKKTIERRFFGGTELVDLAEFAINVIQDEDKALTIACAMLDGVDPYPYNSGSDEPQFYEEFSVVDDKGLENQIQEFNRGEDRYWYDFAPCLGVDGHLDAVSAVVGYTVAGVVDENYGGIIAYVIPECAQRLVNALNTYNASDPVSDPKDGEEGSYNRIVGGPS